MKKKNATFQEFKNQLKVEQLQKKHKNADPFPPGACVMSGDSTLNGTREGNLSKEQTVKLKRSLRASVEDIQDHALLIIRKKRRYMTIHAGTNHPSRSNSRKICSRFLQLKKDKFLT